MMTAAQKAINAKMRGLRPAPRKPDPKTLRRVPRVGNNVPGYVGNAAHRPPQRTRREFT